MKILKNKMEKEREIINNEIGKCPFCNSTLYLRENLEPTDDVIFCNCFCDNCKKEFKETFKLKFQTWDE